MSAASLCVETTYEHSSQFCTMRRAMDGVILIFKITGLFLKNFCYLTDMTVI